MENMFELFDRFERKEYILVKEKCSRVNYTRIDFVLTLSYSIYENHENEYKLVKNSFSIENMKIKQGMCNYHAVFMKASSTPHSQI